MVMEYVRYAFYITLVVCGTYVFVELQRCGLKEIEKPGESMLDNFNIALAKRNNAMLNRSSTGFIRNQSESSGTVGSSVHIKQHTKNREVNVKSSKPYKRWVYKLKGSPHYQKKTKPLDSGFDCVRTKNISHMCEFFKRVTPLPPERQREDSKIDWNAYWTVGSFKNPDMFRENFKTCVVLGSSALTRGVYNYSQFFLESDVVFAVNSKRSWVDIPSSVKVLETFDKDHVNELKFHEYANRVNLITSWADLSHYKSGWTGAKVALPSTEALIKKTATLLGVRNPGFTSGIFMVLWAKSRCTNVKVIGFYGFSTFEYGKTTYSGTSDVSDHKKTEKTGQFYSMLMLLRLNELKQIELVL